MNALRGSVRHGRSVNEIVLHSPGRLIFVAIAIALRGAGEGIRVIIGGIPRPTREKRAGMEQLRAGHLPLSEPLRMQLPDFDPTFQPPPTWRRRTLAATRLGAHLLQEA